MSLNLNPVSVGTRDEFRPFDNSVAHSFTRYLPFGTPARCLSLGRCDIRRLLYTVYAETGNGIYAFLRVIVDFQGIRENMT
jgi:hypothetical protein